RRGRRAKKVAGVDRECGQMARRDMVVVGAVVHQRLPVDRLEPFHGAEGLHTTVPPVKNRVQVPARVTQIGLEARGIRGPGGEDDPGIRVDTGVAEAAWW